MKQLKFMIAAAAAIGLAGAAQAVSFSDVDADNGKDALSNTGFEEFEADTAVTTGTDSYFLYTGDEPNDNESKIIAGQSGLTKAPRAKGENFTADAKVLEVNTGTDPLLRTLGAVEDGDSSAVDLPDGGLYIDTLVQFTVTPAGDTVTPTADDKLMIYLQEVAPVMDGDAVVTPGATNLMVQCKKWVSEENFDTATWEDKFSACTTSVTCAGIDKFETNTWYRLTVKSEIINDVMVFSVWVNGNALNATEGALCNGKSESTYFPTLQATNESKGDTTLKAVGFAGEGWVDDIVFSTTLDADPDTLDFTFTWDETITSVQYTIGNSEPAPVTSGKAIEDLADNTVIKIAVTPATWCVYNGQTEFTVTTDFTETELSATLVGGTGEGATSVDSFVEKASSATDAATALGVNNTAFTTAGAATTDKAVLTKGLNWAKKLGQAPSYLNDINFADSDDAKAKAYLLNCDPKDVDTIDDQFKFEAFSFEIVDGKPEVSIDGVATSWKVGEGDAVLFNGTPVIKGAATPNGTYGDINANSKFFKAFLVK